MVAVSLLVIYRRTACSRLTFIHRCWYPQLTVQVLTSTTLLLLNRFSLVMKLSCVVVAHKSAQEVQTNRHSTTIAHSRWNCQKKEWPNFYTAKSNDPNLPVTKKLNRPSQKGSCSGSVIKTCISIFIHYIPSHGLCIFILLFYCWVEPHVLCLSFGFSIRSVQSWIQHGTPQ